MYEELWHGEAFSRFLGEAGYALGPDRQAVTATDSYPSRRARNAWIRRAAARGGIVSHLAIMAASGLSRDFVAAHMTWGAVNELSTLTGYHRMIANTEHPVLRDLLERIVKDERRHFAFYRAQARLRLAESARAQKVTRWVLEHLWSPVGTGVRPQAETDFVIAELFGGQDGRGAITEMDNVVHALPGLAGVGLFDRACSRVIAAA